MWVEIFLDAWRNLISRKARFFLVSMGIAIGSSAFIILLNIGLSVIEKSMEQFAAVGVDIVTFSPKAISGIRSSHLDQLALENAAKISNNIENLTFITVENSNVKVGGFQQMVSVVGARQSLYPILKLGLERGRFLYSFDGAAAHVVLGSDLARRIEDAGNSEDIQPGSEIIIGNVGFTIVGVMKPQSGNPILPFQVSNMILVRPETMSRFLKVKEPKLAVAQLSSIDTFEKTQKIIIENYRNFVEKGDLKVTSAEQLIQAMTAQSKLIATFLIVIGVVVFGVAGIGVMNSLMTSINERIHEIGVRLAIGAQPGHILSLFLIEASIICLLGGLAGLVLGAITLYSISLYQDIPVTFNVTVILFGVGIISLSGVIFGLFPALKAAWIKPIAALRTD